jgi:hypothetical protein
MMSAVVRGSSDWSVLNQSQLLVLIMSDQANRDRPVIGEDD